MSPLGRQKDKIDRQSVRFKSDVHIVIEHNANLSQFWMQNFDFAANFDGLKGQELSEIPSELKN